MGSDYGDRIDRLEKQMLETRENLSDLKGYIRGVIFSAMGACALIGFAVGTVLKFVGK